VSYMAVVVTQSVREAVHLTLLSLSLSGSSHTVHMVQDGSYSGLFSLSKLVSGYCRGYSKVFTYVVSWD